MKLGPAVRVRRAPAATRLDPADAPAVRPLYGRARARSSLYSTGFRGGGLPALFVEPAAAWTGRSAERPRPVAAGRVRPAAGRNRGRWCGAQLWLGSPLRADGRPWGSLAAGRATWAGLTRRGTLGARRAGRRRR